MLSPTQFCEHLYNVTQAYFTYHTPYISPFFSKLFKEIIWGMMSSLIIHRLAILTIYMHRPMQCISKQFWVEEMARRLNRFRSYPIDTVCLNYEVVYNRPDPLSIKKKMPELTKENEISVSIIEVIFGAVNLRAVQNLCVQNCSSPCWSWCTWLDPCITIWCLT